MDTDPLGAPRVVLPAGLSEGRSGRGWASVLLHDVDVPVGAAEEEPAEAFHVGIGEQVGGPDEVADQLDPCSCEFFAGTDDVVHSSNPVIRARFPVPPGPVFVPVKVQWNSMPLS